MDLGAPRPVEVSVPQVDLEKCIGCGKCGEICQYSAIVAMDKEVAKRLMREAGLPVVEFAAFRRADWERGPDQVLAAVQARFAESPAMSRP